MYFLYTVIFYSLTPFILIRLLWRSIKAPEYRRRWLERFAFYAKKHPEDVIWVHAVSVGEAKAAFPLIEALQIKFPGYKILVTTTTPTGSEIVKKQFGRYVCHVYLPYDLPFCVNRFFDHFKPRIAIFMETEIWPNLFRGAGDRGIPLLIINARLSEKSVRGYQKLHGFFAKVLGNTTLIATQSCTDSERFIALSVPVEKVQHIGNIKFDLKMPDLIQEQGRVIKETLFLSRPVFIIASTHNGEERAVLDFFPELKQAFPSLLLVIVPRHPERFSSVTTMVANHGYSYRLRSDEKPCNLTTDVFIVDTIGELNLFYVASDITFIGGSLVPVGGHNPLEAGALAKPILFGKHVFNFADITEQLLNSDAAIQCQGSKQLAREVALLLANKKRRLELGERAKAFVEKNQGSIIQLLRIVTKSLEKSSYISH